MVAMVTDKVHKPACMTGPHGLDRDSREVSAEVKEIQALRGISGMLFSQ